MKQWMGNELVRRVGGWLMSNQSIKHQQSSDRSRRPTYQQNDQARHDDEEDKLRASLSLA